MEAQLHILIMAVGTLVALFLGGLIGKLLIEQISLIKDERIKAFAKMGVVAAAQKIPDVGARYDWVAKKVAEKFKWLSEAEIETLIESAVKGFKKEFGATVPTPPAT